MVTDDKVRDSIAAAHLEQKFSDIFSYGWLISRSFPSAQVTVPTSLDKSIALTTEGEKYMARIGEKLHELTTVDAKLGLLFQYGHEETFINLESTDPQPLHDFLRDSIIAGKLRHPWIFGRTLYDKGFELLDSDKTELDSADTERILNDTPPGVFQIGRHIVGPFGLIESSCHRVLPPKNQIATRHCSDPSCSHINLVTLGQMKWGPLTAQAFVMREILRTGVESTSWLHIFKTFQKLPNYYDDMSTENLPGFLADAFSESEFRAILAGLLRADESVSSELQTLKGKETRNSPEKITSGMTKAECFQLCLVSSDRKIIEIVDTLIDKGIIRIPLTEKRVRKFPNEEKTWFSISSECSRYGIRFISESLPIATGRLKRIILETHQGDEGVTQLQWILRHQKGKELVEKLDNYVAHQNPRSAIKDMVMSSPAQLKKTFEVLRFGRFTFPSSEEEEQDLVNRILWKLGFEIDLYPPYEALFWERKRKFLDTAMSTNDSTEPGREQIRSAGVNFFISLEEVLDYGLSFMTWALLSNHVDDTGFKCNFDFARKVMASKLSGSIITGEMEELAFDPSGKNTLFALIHGFKALAEKCKGLLQEPPDKHVRKEHELPMYVAHTDILSYPFRHRILFLDLERSVQEGIVERLEWISSQLSKVGASEIRNKLDHKRPDFPSRHEIEDACKGIEEVVAIMESEGILPSVFYFVGEEFDQFHRGIVIMRDYKGTEVRFNRPSSFEACGLPDFNRPLIIVGSLRFGHSIEPLRFQYEESSDYVEMWRGFPRRKTYDENVMAPTPVPAA